MSSKRRASKLPDRQADEPARAASVSAPSDSLLDRIIGRLKTLKGAIVAVAGGAVLGGLAGYWNAYQAARSSTQSSAQLLALVGKGDAGPLSIVVLPFANLTGDPQQAYVADGITAAVTADLSRIRDAFIVSTATAFAYKDKPVTVQQIGKELGVRFALQGGVQRSGDKIRINAQLADTTNNAQLWSESFDGSQGDLFALQEMVTTRIGNSIGREMLIVAARDSEARRSDQKVIDLLLRARALSLAPESSAGNLEIATIYRQALAIEPNNARAMGRLAAHLASAANNTLKSDPIVKEKQLTEAHELAMRAKQIDPAEKSTYDALAIYAMNHGDSAAARGATTTVLSLDPKNPSRYHNLAAQFANDGKPAKAIELLTEAIRLDPRRVDEATLGNMGVAKFMLGNDDEAIVWLRKSLDKAPGAADYQAYPAMAYARKGDLSRSRSIVEALLRSEPKFSLLELDSPARGFPPAFRDFWETKLLPAYRLAGLPE